MFIHAFSRCDTTSSIHEKMKGSVVKLISKSRVAQEKTLVFYRTDVSQEEISKAGQKMVMLYVGAGDDTLAAICHRTYMRMAASSSKIIPGKLPPTDRAAFFHSLHVYLQVIISYEF